MPPVCRTRELASGRKHKPTTVRETRKEKYVDMASYMEQTGTTLCVRTGSRINTSRFQEPGEVTEQNNALERTDGMGTAGGTGGETPGIEKGLSRNKGMGVMADEVDFIGTRALEELGHRRGDTVVQKAPNGEGEPETKI